MAEPDVAVATAIDTALASLTINTNLFRGPVRPFAAIGSSVKVPHQAVFCLTTGGPNPVEFVQGNTGPDIRQSSVQVRVRSNVGDFDGGQTLAEQVWTALQRATSSGYMSLTCRESAPVYLGKDDTEHHEWSINVDTLRED